ncbi:hypothetical protein CVT24_000122 [Panaeolus cyanescens]|uniref:Uncharacterized protein n=1 Tax=Panaeolus cyanescens TaxID=181874 RepID=A0A409W7G3_9AGAR|nr:hypothetical protein CVT24_000122 [Panaeolus cyanescens]
MKEITDDGEKGYATMCARLEIGGSTSCGGGSGGGDGGGEKPETDTGNGDGDAGGDGDGDGKYTIFVNAATWPAGKNAWRSRGEGTGRGKVNFGGLGFQPVVVDLLDEV